MTSLLVVRPLRRKFSGGNYDRNTNFPLKAGLPNMHANKLVVSLAVTLAWTTKKEKEDTKESLRD